MDLALPLESIRTTVSRFLPWTLFIYLPRVANSIADDLAGQASRFLLSKCQRDGRTAIKNTGHTSINPTLPIPLLQIGGFHIQSWEPPWMTRVITLVEQPNIDHGLLRRHLTLSPQHRALIESYLAPYSTQCPCIEVPYSARSEDGLGRKYCLTWEANDCPKKSGYYSSEKLMWKLTLRDPFMNWCGGLVLAYCPTAHHSPPLMNFVTFSPVTHTYARSGKNARTPSSDYPCASSTAPLTLHITTLTP